MADSPLFVKTYDLLHYLIPVTQDFPRSQRFVLAKRIQDAALDFHESLLEARKVDLETRVGVLRRADVELEKLRLHLRLSMEQVPQVQPVRARQQVCGRDRPYAACLAQGDG